MTHPPSSATSTSRKIRPSPASNFGQIPRMRAQPVFQIQAFLQLRHLHEASSISILSQRRTCRHAPPSGNHCPTPMPYSRTGTSQPYSPIGNRMPCPRGGIDRNSWPSTGIIRSTSRGATFSPSRSKMGGNARRARRRWSEPWRNGLQTTWTWTARRRLSIPGGWQMICSSLPTTARSQHFSMPSGPITTSRHLWRLIRHGRHSTRDSKFSRPWSRGRPTRFIFTMPRG